jgi:hypothetical protein
MTYEDEDENLAKEEDYQKSLNMPRREFCRFVDAS